MSEPSASEELRVVVVDDQALVREGFTALLGAQHGVRVVGTAADGAEAVAVCRALALAGAAPDVVLMDVRMPVRSGIDATAEIVASPELVRTRVLVLTTFDLDEHVHAALRVGASGFLLKHATAADLVSAVRTVARGEALLDPALTRRLISHYVSTHREAAHARDVPTRLAQLTPKEVEVLSLVARGLSNREVAEQVFVTEQTVKSHVSRIFTKLDLRDRAQAVVFAYECGLVRPAGS